MVNIKVCHENEDVKLDFLVDFVVLYRGSSSCLVFLSKSHIQVESSLYAQDMAEFSEESTLRLPDTVPKLLLPS
jgi:hypothetical protein